MKLSQKKYKDIILVLLGILLLFGVYNYINSRDTDLNKILQNGQEAFLSKEYDEASTFYKFALENGCENEEIAKKEIIISDYLSAESFVENGEYTKAKEVLDNISDDYLRYEIKDDIDILKKKVTEYTVKSDLKHEIKNTERVVFSESERSGYKKYKNTKLKYSIDVPEDLIEESVPNENGGINIKNMSKDTELLVWVKKNPGFKTNEDIYMQELKSADKVEYSYLGEKSHILSWRDSKKIFYEMQIVSGENIYTYLLSYPEFRRESMNNVIENINNSFVYY